MSAREDWEKKMRAGFEDLLAAVGQLGGPYCTLMQQAMRHVTLILLGSLAAHAGVVPGGGAQRKPAGYPPTND